MSSHAFLLLLITALLWGGTPILEKAALKITDPVTGIFIRSAFITFIMLIICLLTGKWQTVLNTPLKAKMLFCLSGLMAGLLGMFTYYHALRISPVSKAVPIAAAYPLVAAVLGVIFLGEQITLFRVLGVAFIIFGVWLVK